VETEIPLPAAGFRWEIISTKDRLLTLTLPDAGSAQAPRITQFTGGPARRC